MTTDVTKTLRRALAELQADRKEIDRQIAVMENALTSVAGRQRRGSSQSRGRKQGRPKAMSAAARKAVSRRMKAYWKERRAEAAKGKERAGK